jgi:alpha-galactosidase
MNVDSRFRLDIERVESCARMHFASISEHEALEPVSTLATLRFETLCDLSEAPKHLRESLRVGALFCNGWQSWSFGGELSGSERVARARILSILNLYTDRPGPLARRGETLSNFIGYFRTGLSYLVLVSLGSPDCVMPPVAFRFARGRGEVTIEVLAEGARLSAGQRIAEICVFFTEGYFSFKERLKGFFVPQERFARLAFLGHDNLLVPGGYESWYNHYTNISESGITRDIVAITSQDNLVNAYYLRRGKPMVFQIDDGWERAVGEWEPDSVKFPRGMKVLADAIEARGMTPGLWIAPLLVTRSSALVAEHPQWLLRDDNGVLVVAGWNPGWDGKFFCLDLSQKEVEDYLANLFHRIIEEWGYRYIKLDFLYAGFMRGNRREGGAAFEHYDRVMRRLTSTTIDSRGRPVAYLGCGAPLEPSFRYFPLMRIGADTKESWERPALRCLRYQGRPAARVNLAHTIGRTFFDETVFVNDPDVMFCRRNGMRLSENEKELIALVDFMLASQIMFSDGGDDFSDPRVAVFTAKIIGFFDRLAGRRYGALRIDRDLYSLFSEDGRISGIVNLSDRAHLGPAHDEKKAIVAHAHRTRRGLHFEPHSISLFEE